MKRSDGPDHEVVVMTRNLYAGTDYTSFLSPPPGELGLPQAVEAEWQQVIANNFPERAPALAAEIAAERPDVIGLQEVTLLSSTSQTTGEPGPGFDHLEILLGELSARAAPYRAVAVTHDFDASMPTLPAAVGGADLVVRIIDRDVILVRDDLPATTIEVLRTQSGQFEERMILLGMIPLLRGWVAADLRVRGITFRIVSTHLEPYDERVQLQQAQALIAGPAQTELPLVLLGDFNSGSPESETSFKATFDYLMQTAHRLTDAWATVEADAPGFTSSQQADLRNRASQLSSRIDLVLTRCLQPKRVMLVGDSIEARTASGLWPSDHAGLWVVLGLGENRDA
jgi:endonuclease/exonuclease/phosphatase family metal-dependent hydrolase